jgi:hypothetical protein
MSTAAKKREATPRLGRPPRQPGAAEFPPLPIESAMDLAKGIQEHGAGESMRRLTLFEKLDKAPDSSASRMMITNSNRYKLTQGGYQADIINLTNEGKLATSPDVSEVEKRKALFQLAIQSIEPFRYLYERLKGKRLPSPEVMRDWLGDAKVAEKDRKVCVEVFVENAKFLGLLRTISGAERLLSIEHVIEELEGKKPAAIMAIEQQRVENKDIVAGDLSKKDWKKICFFIAPIGEDGHEERKHSNMVLEALITRALEGDGFEVVRADRITDPGKISEQVLEYISRSGLVIADLSFHNPNVFYELAIRHMTGKATVHIIRQCDVIPFDLKDFRTVIIDTDDKYELIARLETYRTEISTAVRAAIALGDTDSTSVKSLVTKYS